MTRWNTHRVSQHFTHLQLLTLMIQVVLQVQWIAVVRKAVATNGGQSCQGLADLSFVIGSARLRVGLEYSLFISCTSTSRLYSRSTKSVGIPRWILPSTGHGVNWDRMSYFAVELCQRPTKNVNQKRRGRIHDHVKLMQRTL